MILAEFYRRQATRASRNEARFRPPFYVARSIGGTTRGNLSKWFTLLGNSWLSSSINRVEIVETHSRRTSLCINLRFQRVSRVSFVTSLSRASRKPLRLHNPAYSFTLFTITTKKKLDLNHGLSHRIQAINCILR